MRARLIPLFFRNKDDEFDKQIQTLGNLFNDDIEILPPYALGSELPEADAVVFPQLLGDAYQDQELFQQIKYPILIITSEFGTLSMWDWEICSYLKSAGVNTIAPYDVEQTRKVFSALICKRELQQTSFLVYQDDPGEGFQASIFKRFYWWEDECVERMKTKFGLNVKKKSFQELGSRARLIPDSRAESRLAKNPFPQAGLTARAQLSAVKLFLAIEDDLEYDPTVRAVGINCLNESHFSDTTPCLAWNLLFEEQKMIWGCEADILSMLSKYLIYHILKLPVMMTNLYPFLMGQAALKHEKIPEFPRIGEPENHLLVAHCGYLGVVPQSFATQWKLKRKVLSIVDENATAIDARLPIGKVTLAKLNPTFDRMSVVIGDLEDYVQFPNSDCLNGGIIRVAVGRKIIKNLDSHHYILITGDCRSELDLIAPILSLDLDHY